MLYNELEKLDKLSDRYLATHYRMMYLAGRRMQKASEKYNTEHGLSFQDDEAMKQREIFFASDWYRNRQLTAEKIKNKCCGFAKEAKLLRKSHSEK